MKIAIVTGGSKGLGEMISSKLIKHGFRVYSVSRDPGKGSVKIETRKVDISSELNCRKLIKHIVSKEGRLDLLINNAGVNDKNDILKTFGVNVFGPYYLIKESIPLLKKSKGRIINITSLNGIIPTPESAIYSSSKHALEGLGIALSYEVENLGIYLTNIAPGAIHNPQSKALTHMALRDKYPFLKVLFPMTTKELVSERVMQAVLSKKPSKRIVVGVDAIFASFLYRHFPNLWFWVIRRLYKK